MKAKRKHHHHTAPGWNVNYRTGLVAGGALIRLWQIFHNRFRFRKIFRNRFCLMVPTRCPLPFLVQALPRSAKRLARLVAGLAALFRQIFLDRTRGLPFLSVLRLLQVVENFPQPCRVPFYHQRTLPACCRSLTCRTPHRPCRGRRPHRGVPENFPESCRVPFCQTSHRPCRGLCPNHLGKIFPSVFLGAVLAWSCLPSLVHALPRSAERRTGLVAGVAACFR